MIIQGNALSLPIADNTIQCVVTSPPYYGLRDYGISDQIGLEPTPDEYITKMVQVFREVHRVMKDDGVLWLNLGDSYAGSGNGSNDYREDGASLSKNDNKYGKHKPGMTDGYKPKDLLGIPWMLAFALRADGWYLRSDVIWNKPNPMPESVKDRPTKSHEYVFLLTKSAKYYYDAEAIFEPAADISIRRVESGWNCDRVNISPDGNGSIHTDKMGDRWLSKKRGFKTKDQLPDNQHHGADIETGIPARNKRSVWTINTQPFKGAHFAVMPEKLVEPCVLASSGVGDTILDPFAGSGTVGVVAQKHGRKFIGIELNPEYVKMAEERLLGAPIALPMEAR